MMGVTLRSGTAACTHHAQGVCNFGMRLLGVIEAGGAHGWPRVLQLGEGSDVPEHHSVSGAKSLLERNNACPTPHALLSN